MKVQKARVPIPSICDAKWMTVIDSPGWDTSLSQVNPYLKSIPNFS